MGGLNCSMTYLNTCDYTYDYPLLNTSRWHRLLPLPAGPVGPVHAFSTAAAGQTDRQIGASCDKWQEKPEGRLGSLCTPHLNQQQQQPQQCMPRAQQAALPQTSGFPPGSRVVVSEGPMRQQRQQLAGIRAGIAGPLGPFSTSHPGVSNAGSSAHSSCSSMSDMVSCSGPRPTPAAPATLSAHMVAIGSSTPSCGGDSSSDGCVWSCSSPGSWSGSTHSTDSRAGLDGMQVAGQGLGTVAGRRSEGAGLANDMGQPVAPGFRYYHMLLCGYKGPHPRVEQRQHHNMDDLDIIIAKLKLNICCHKYGYPGSTFPWHCPLSPPVGPVGPVHAFSTAAAGHAHRLQGAAASCDKWQEKPEGRLGSLCTPHLNQQQQQPQQCMPRAQQAALPQTSGFPPGSRVIVSEGPMRQQRQQLADIRAGIAGPLGPFSTSHPGVSNAGSSAHSSCSSMSDMVSCSGPRPTPAAPASSRHLSAHMVAIGSSTPSCGGDSSSDGCEWSCSSPAWSSGSTHSIDGRAGLNGTEVAGQGSGTVAGRRSEGAGLADDMGQPVAPGFRYYHMLISGYKGRWAMWV